MSNMHKDFLRQNLNTVVGGSTASATCDRISISREIVPVPRSDAFPNRQSRGGSLDNAGDLARGRQ